MCFWNASPANRGLLTCAAAPRPVVPPEERRPAWLPSKSSAPRSSAIASGKSCTRECQFDDFGHVRGARSAGLRTHGTGKRQAQPRTRQRPDNVMLAEIGHIENIVLAGFGLRVVSHETVAHRDAPVGQGFFQAAF